tara:strand:+ start:4067 stop:4579 length:513 start_codon:yes stop_codon:yes gene_type:complete
MKKISKILLCALLISCADSNKGIEKQLTNSKEVKSQDAEVENSKKEWVEFEIRAVGNTMSDMKFDIENIQVNNDSWVRIILINEGEQIAMKHNIVFVNYGSRKEVATQAINAGPNMKYVPNNANIIASSDLAEPGETVILEFKAPNKGNYEYVCTYPGHSESMRGYFIVK